MLSDLIEDNYAVSDDLCCGCIHVDLQQLKYQTAGKIIGTGS